MVFVLVTNQHQHGADVKEKDETEEEIGNVTRKMHILKGVSLFKIFAIKLYRFHIVLLLKKAATAQSSSPGADNENNVESSEPLLADTSTNGK